LNKLVEELEQIYQHGSPLKIATEEETEIVLKEIEEQKKQKELEEIAAKKLQIELLAKSLLNKKLDDQKTSENVFDLKEFNNNDPIYKGEMVVVQMEDEEDNNIIDLD
jgi:hypothetical protein